MRPIIYLSIKAYFRKKKKIQNKVYSHFLNDFNYNAKCKLVVTSSWYAFCWEILLAGPEINSI